MTDEENQRQRHLAEMMIAQCDGKTVQFKAKGEPWSDVSILLSDCDTERREFRIKPEPREWWTCLACGSRTTALIKSPHFPRGSNTSCCGEIVHIIEVLND